MGAKASPLVSTIVSWHDSVTGRPAQRCNTADFISIQTVRQAIDYLALCHILQSSVWQGLQHSCE